MKINHLYLDVLLTVVAVCLIGILIQNQLLIEELKRERVSAEGYSRAGLGALPVSNRTTDYALVPVNADGSVNVRIAAGSETMNVNVDQVNGYKISNGELPVKANMIDVNIERIDGRNLHETTLPVRAERLDVNVEAVNGHDISGYDLPISGN